MYPSRSKSSLSNVSNTHISSSNSDIHCHRSRHKHLLKNGVHVPSANPVHENIGYRKHHHHHKEKDYNSETNSGAEQVKRYNKKNNEHYRNSADFSKTNGEKMFNNDVMDQSFKKATKIVHELTRHRENNIYEKHKQKCITASEKYDVDILKHYNARKSTSVLDFRSEIHIGPKHDTKSADELDENNHRLNDRGNHKVKDARSVKSLDFDSDCNTTNTNSRSKERNTYDYNSESNSDYNSVKAKPAPPKKPLRLSLQKTHSLQSVDNMSCNGKNERKSMKRNHKGEMPPNGFKTQNGDSKYREHLKWNFRKSVDSCLENGSWC